MCDNEEIISYLDALIAYKQSWFKPPLPFISNNCLEKIKQEYRILKQSEDNVAININTVSKSDLTELLQRFRNGNFYKPNEYSISTKNLNEPEILDKIQVLENMVNYLNSKDIVTVEDKREIKKLSGDIDTLRDQLNIVKPTRRYYNDNGLVYNGGKRKSKRRKSKNPTKKGKKNRKSNKKSMKK